MFAYNSCAWSERDLARLRTLQRDFLPQARTILVQSSPVEHVVLVQVQVLALAHPQRALAATGSKTDAAI
jgi:hypothetical protein